MKKLIPLFIVLICMFAMSIPAWAVDEDVTHTVKKGDTLWDISNMYLKTPWQWPLIWANNKDITNPHKIYPGDIVVLKHRDGAVEVKIIPTVAQPEAPAAEKPADANMTIMTVEQMIQEKEKSVMVSPQFASLIYSKDPLQGKGSFIQKEDIGQMAAVGDIIFIRMNTPTTEKYLSLITKVTDVEQGKTKKGREVISGYLYKIIAIASILENQDGLIKARITRAVQEVKVGDLVSDDLAIQPMALKMSQVSEKIGGKIVDLYGGKNVGVGTNGLIFMDIGSKDGLLKGSLVNINKSIAITGGGTMKEYQGMALVLQTLENTSMALVVEALAPIVKGYQVSTK